MPPLVAAAGTGLATAIGGGTALASLGLGALSGATTLGLGAFGSSEQEQQKQQKQWQISPLAIDLSQKFRPSLSIGGVKDLDLAGRLSRRLA